MPANPHKGLQNITTDPYGSVRLPESLIPDTGNSDLNAIIRGQNAVQRNQDYNALIDQQDRENGTLTPFWQRQRLSNAFGQDLGDQMVEGQNEIADTGQNTRLDMDNPEPKPRNSPSFIGLQSIMQKQRENTLAQWGKNARAETPSAMPGQPWTVGSQRTR